MAIDAVNKEQRFAEVQSQFSNHLRERKVVEKKFSPNFSKGTTIPLHKLEARKIRVLFLRFCNNELTIC